MESFGHSFSIGPEFIYVEHPQKLMRYGWGQTSELLSDPLLNRSELRCVLPMGKENTCWVLSTKGCLCLRMDA